MVREIANGVQLDMVPALIIVSALSEEQIQHGNSREHRRRHCISFWIAGFGSRDRKEGAVEYVASDARFHAARGVILRKNIDAVGQFPNAQHAQDAGVLAVGRCRATSRFFRA